MDLSLGLFNKLERIIYVDLVGQKELKNLLTYIQAQSIHTEVILDSINPEEIIGIVLPSYKAGLFKKHTPLGRESRQSHQFEVQLLPTYSTIAAKELAVLKKQKEQTEKEILTKFSEANHYHKKIKHLFESAVTDSYYQQVIEEVTSSLSNESSPYTKQISLPDNIFISALSYNGPIHLIHKMSKQVKRKIILKGNVGKFKSDLLYRLSNDLKKINHRVIQCHCPFEPSELDMIVIPELNVMIVDGDKPHELEISHPQDKQINLEERCVNHMTILKEISLIKEYYAKYKQKMRQGTLYLQDMRSTQQHIEFIRNQYQEKDSTNIKHMFTNLIG